MMPELGKYAFAVLASYGVTLALIAAISALSLARARRMRRQLESLEQRMRGDG